MTHPTNKPASKVKIALLWLFLIGNIVFWVTFWIWWQRGRMPAGESPPDLMRSIIMLFFGLFFLVAGVVSYFVVTFTQCFTFDFTRPVWSGLKGKLYVANIIVPLLPALGLGFALSAFLTPALLALGLDGTLASLLPILSMVVLLQVTQVFILIWAPLEKRLITKRVMALGITAEQLPDAILIGISNPQLSSFKKFAMVEEDVGALWINPGQLVFYGDKERFSITREQLVQIERKGDAGSTTMLLGITHVILHVRLTDGNERQIRLHTEGLWHMGHKRRTMDELSDRITEWHAAPAPAPPPIPV